MKLNPKQREELRMKFGGFCAYCGIVLDGKWHADHVEAVVRQTKWMQPGVKPGRYVATGKCYRPHNERMDNLFPSCASCNIDKGSSELESWRHRLGQHLIDVLRRNTPNFRHAERFGRVIVVNEPVVFWFEKFVREMEKKG